MRRERKQKRDRHSWESAADGGVECHEPAVAEESDEPDSEVDRVDRASRRILAQEEVTRDLDGDHRGKDRANEVKKPRNIIHRVEHCRSCAEHGHTDADTAPRYGVYDALA